MSRRAGILVLGLGALVLFVYLPSFPGEFHFDDFALMLENSHVTGPDFSYRLFLEEYGGRPLTLWTFHWNYRLAGADPWSYHVVSLILHLVGAVLLLVWVNRSTLDETAGILAAAVFALHPLQTQAVNYIWSRSVLLMFCFGAASLLLAGKKSQAGRFESLHHWLSLLCFQLAIWSRADGLIFLVPLLLGEGVPRRWADARCLLIRNRAAVLVALVNLGAFAFFMAEYNPREIGWTHPHILGYWWAQAVAFWKYVAAMLWPSGLSIDHYFSVTGLWSPVLALLGLAVLSFGLWKSRVRYPVVVSGAVWVCLALGPAALVPNSDPFNESRAYPALAGFAVVLAGVFHSVSDRLRRVTVSVAVLLLLAMIPATAARNYVWRSDLVLWEDAAQKSPQKARVHYNLGAAWARSGDVLRAEQSFNRALVLDPGDDLSYAALGYCAEVKQDWKLALERYQRAISLNSRNSYADEGRRRVREQAESQQQRL